MARHGGVLAHRVFVEGRAYGPGPDVPDEIAEQITNPKAWAIPPAPPAPPRRAVKSKAT